MPSKSWQRSKRLVALMWPTSGLLPAPCVRRQLQVANLLRVDAPSRIECGREATMARKLKLGAIERFTLAGDAILTLVRPSVR
jgi:hypothetical protein